MLAHRLELHTIEITKPMRKSFRAACQRYEIHVEEEKKLQRRCFPVNIAKCLKTSILKNICERLLLKFNESVF